jgi:DivIVA protein
MPDESSAADEHALLQEITAPFGTLSDDAAELAADPEFPVAFRGYDRLAVDAYVKKTSQLIAELQSTRSPEAAVRRALERVGDQIAGVLKRAHETAEQITTQSRREAEDRLESARQEAIQIAAAGEQRVKDLDADTDRIWAERLRIVEDARELAAQLLALADTAAARFPPAEDAAGGAAAERPSAAPYDAEDDQTAEATAPAAETAPEAPPQPDEKAEAEQTVVLPPKNTGESPPPAGPAPEAAPPPQDPPPA